MEFYQERTIELRNQVEEVENRALLLFDAFAELAVRANASPTLLREVGTKALGSIEWVAAIRDRRLEELRQRLNPPAPPEPLAEQHVTAKEFRDGLGLEQAAAVASKLEQPARTANVWHHHSQEPGLQALRVEDEEGDQASRLPSGQWWWSRLDGQNLQLVSVPDQALVWPELKMRTRWKVVHRATAEGRESPIKFERQTYS